MKHKVSVVIPNYNGEAYLTGCLDSLKNQTETNFNIIVVDDASTDGSIDILKARPEVQLIQNSKNAGFDVSVNRGIMASDAPFVLLLNNDVEVTADFIKNLLSAVQERERIFSVSSRMVRFKERDRLDDTGDFVNILGWAWKRGDGKPVTKYKKASPVFSTCAGAGIYRRRVFEEIGLFDERFFAYLEDIDLSWRAMIHGYENRYAPDAVCYHIGSATTAEGNKYSPFKVEISARNNIYTAYKNMPALQLIVNSPFLLCGFLVKGVMFQAKGYGKAYRKGIKTGLTTLHTVKKTPFKAKHTLNYLKIEAMLLGNVLRYLGEKGTGKQ